MPVPVGELGAKGVVPLAVGVVGHGSSVHVGRTQLLSRLQVALSVVE